MTRVDVCMSTSGYKAQAKDGELDAKSASLMSRHWDSGDRTQRLNHRQGHCRCKMSRVTWISDRVDTLASFKAKSW